MRARLLAVVASIIVGIAAFAALATPDASAYEHVRNGGFELGTEGWSAGYGATITSAQHPEVAPADGTSSGKVMLGGTRFELRPAMSGPVDAGTYEFSAQVLTSYAGSVRAQVHGSGFEGSTMANAQPGVWTPLRMAVNATAAGELSISISGSGAPGDVLYVDAVRLIGAPPVTLTPTAAPALAATTPVPSATGLASPTATPTTARADAIAAHLRNASFEEIGDDGLPFAWAKFGGTLSVAPDRARSGRHAARVDSNTASTKWLYQTVLVEPGATYAFEAWIWHDDPAVAAAFLRVSWYASADGGGESITSVDSTTRLDTPISGYRHLTTGAINAPANARTARLRVMLAPSSGAPAAIFVDDAAFSSATPLAPVVAAPVPDDDAGAESLSAGSARPSRSTGSAASGAGVFASAHSSGADAPTLVINEVLFDADTAGADAEGEWVEIYNPGGHDVSLAGWTLRDNARASSVPDIIIPAGDFAVVAASDSFLATYPDFLGVVAWLDGRLGNGLGNDGDSLELISPTGTVVDAISWGDESSILEPPIDAVPAGHSIERRMAGVDTNAAEDFVDNNDPSPGRPFDADATNPKPLSRTTTVEVLEATGAQDFDWVPWALVAVSGVALAGAVAWRAIEAVRARSRPA
ncbi:MAG: lamin tail domain-containing protein [Dehalococcoidia bacterium]